MTLDSIFINARGHDEHFHMLAGLRNRPGNMDQWHSVDLSGRLQGSTVDLGVKPDNSILRILIPLASRMSFIRLLRPPARCRRKGGNALARVSASMKNDFICPARMSEVFAKRSARVSGMSIRNIELSAANDSNLCLNGYVYRLATESMTLDSIFINARGHDEHFHML